MVKELKKLFEGMVNKTGIDKVVAITASVFETRVISACLVELSEDDAYDFKLQCSDVAYSLQNHASQNAEKNNWANVAFNLDPRTGNTNKVSRRW